MILSQLRNNWIATVKTVTLYLAVSSELSVPNCFNFTSVKRSPLLSRRGHPAPVGWVYCFWPVLNGHLAKFTRLCLDFLAKAHWTINVEPLCCFLLSIEIREFVIVFVLLIFSPKPVLSGQPLFFIPRGWLFDYIWIICAIPITYTNSTMKRKQCCTQLMECHWKQWLYIILIFKAAYPL